MNNLSLKGLLFYLASIVKQVIPHLAIFKVIEDAEKL